MDSRTWLAVALTAALGGAVSSAPAASTFENFRTLRRHTACGRSGSGTACWMPTRWTGRSAKWSRSTSMARMSTTAPAANAVPERRVLSNREVGVRVVEEARVSFRPGGRIRVAGRRGARPLAAGTGKPRNRAEPRIPHAQSVVLFQGFERRRKTGNRWPQEPAIRRGGAAGGARCAGRIDNSRWSRPRPGAERVEWSAPRRRLEADGLLLDRARAATAGWWIFSTGTRRARG